MINSNSLYRHILYSIFKRTNTEAREKFYQLQGIFDVTKCVTNSLMIEIQHNFSRYVNNDQFVNKNYIIK